MQNTPSNFSAPSQADDSVKMTPFEKKIQVAINKFLISMQKIGFNQEGLNKIAAKLLTVTEDRTMLKVISVLSNEEIQDWQAKTANTQDPFEKLSKLDLLYQKRTGQSIEELQAEILLGLIDSTVSMLVERPALEEKMNKLNLTDEQAEAFIQQIASGNIEDFENKLSSVAQ